MFILMQVNLKMHHFLCDFCLSTLPTSKFLHFKDTICHFSGWTEGPSKHKWMIVACSQTCSSTSWCKVTFKSFCYTPFMTFCIICFLRETPAHVWNSDLIEGLMRQPGNYISRGWQAAFMTLNQIITATETEKYVNNNTCFSNGDHRVRGDRVSGRICQWSVVNVMHHFVLFGGWRGDLNILLLFCYFSVNAELLENNLLKLLWATSWKKHPVFLRLFRDVTGTDLDSKWGLCDYMVTTMMPLKIVF